MVTAAQIELPDAQDAGGTGRAELVRLALPDRAGLLMQRWPDAPPGLDRAGRLVDRRSRAAVRELRTDLHFVELHRDELTRAALSLAGLAQTRTVVVCPEGVSPGRTALALAVAGLLRDRRGGHRPVVACAVCPPLGQDVTALPHEVRVDVAGQTQYRVVWELIASAYLPSHPLVVRTDNA
jgi:hypothetical protein